MRSLSPRALAATLGMVVLFGTSFVASKIALAAFSPAQLVFCRFAVAALIFRITGRLFPREELKPQLQRKLFYLALLEPGLYFFLEAYGLRLTLASTASVLIATLPIWVVLLEVAWLGFSIALREVGLLSLSLGGVALLVFGSGQQAWGGSLLGNLLVLGAALTAAAYTLLARALLTHVHAVTVTRAQAYYALPIFLPLALWDLSRGVTPRWDWQSVAAAVYLGFACSFLAYLLLNYALRQARASLVAAFSNLIPVVATGLSVLLLGETLGKWQALGAALTIGAVTALTFSHSEAAESPPAA